MILFVISISLLIFSSCEISEGTNGRTTVWVLTESATGNHKTVYIYNNQGNLKQNNSSDWNIDYKYDSDGKLVSAVSGDDSGDKFRYEYRYDSDGKMTEEIVYQDNEIYDRTEYEYDNSGNRVLATNYRDGQCNSSTQYTYDENGKLTLEVEYRDETEYARVEYQYDENGALIKMIRDDGGIGSSFSTIYEYDKNRCIKKSITDWGGGQTESTYKYKKVRMSLEQAKAMQSEFGMIQIIIPQ